MKVERITIETIRIGNRTQENAVILWTEDGKPHTLPDVDHNVAYPTWLSVDEKFEILPPNRVRVQPLPTSPYVEPDGQFYPLGKRNVPDRDAETEKAG